MDNSGRISIKNRYTFRTLTDKDEPAVKELVRNTFNNFLGGEYWEWKYVHNPSFDPSLVTIAESNGVVVGCHHWLVGDMKIAKSSSIRAVLGADMAIEPSQRKQGISKSLLLFLRSKNTIRNKSIAVSYGFIDPQLAKRLHRPSIGFVSIPTSTVTYTRLLSWNRIISGIRESTHNLLPESKLGKRIAKLNLSIGFKISGSPALTVKIVRGRIEAQEEAPQDTDITIVSDVATIARLKLKGNRTRRLLKAVLTGKIKVRGSFLNIVGFCRNYLLFREILGIVLG